MVHGPIDLGGRPALVLRSDPDLPAARLEEAGALVECERLSPLRADPRVAELHPRQVVVDTLRGVRLGDVLGAIRHGGREFFLVTGPGDWMPGDVRTALRVALSRTVRRRLARLPLTGLLERLVGRRLDPRWPTLESTLRGPEAIVAHARVATRQAQRVVPARGPLRIAHYISQLGAGGAERQLTCLALGSHEAGHRVSVYVESLDGAQAHYLPALERAGIPCLRQPLVPRDQVTPPYHGPGQEALPREPARLLEEHLRMEALFPLLRSLQADAPDVLHCWLDQGNAVGGLAGVLAGVPRVVLGLRSLNPTHFPHLLTPWFRDTYRALARSERVTFVANSEAGAADYAAWLEVPRDRLRVVHNGLDLTSYAPLPGPERERERARLGLARDAFVVLGIFRVGPEKRPLDFLDTLVRAREEAPRLRALHLGSGPLEEMVRREAADRGLDDVLTFLGRVPDPWTYLRVADALLLTSEVEGCPNVVLESQAAHVPVVATRVGGTPEVLDEGRTGFLCDVGDIGGLAGRLIELAGDSVRRRTLGAVGRALVEERFSSSSMVEQTLALYR